MTELPTTASSQKTIIRTSIINKWLLLIVINFVLNGIWLALLATNLHQTDQLAQLERKESERVEQANHLMALYNESSNSLLTFLASGDVAWKYKGRDTLDQFIGELNELKNNSVFSPGQEKALKAMVKFFNEEYASTDALPADPQTESTSQALTTFASNRKRLLSQIRKSVGDQSVWTDFFRAQRTQLDELRQKQANCRSALNNSLMVAVVSNSAMAFLMLFAFAKNNRDKESM